LVRAWAVALFASALLFSLAPGIDLRVSGLFAADGHFPLADVRALERVRQVIWQASQGAVVLAIIGLVASGATGRPALWLPQRAWGFILALYVLAPGIVVNAGLKTHWGRARPANVSEFGGMSQFTPALMPADECLRNCSFVSGEAASAAALAISLVVALVALRGRMSPRAFRLWICVAVAVAVVGGLLRVATGRHFLSDVVFAWLMTAGVALALRALARGRLADLLPNSRHAQNDLAPSS
jgi:lipid A 4'-phosphatase